MMDKIIISSSCNFDVDGKTTDCTDNSTIAPSNVLGNVKKTFVSEFEKENDKLQKNGNPLSMNLESIPTESDNCVTINVKNPSYLNLSCCINGYSSMTSYDSKLRKYVRNKPIEGSTSNSSTDSSSNSVGCSKSSQFMVKNNIKNKDMSCDQTNPVESPKSFVQQRVERLYGEKAITSGLYNPKKFIEKNEDLSIQSTHSIFSNNTCLDNLKLNEITNDTVSISSDENRQQELPVFRFLRPEFKAQLPLSSKKVDKEKVGASSDTSIKSTTSPNKNYEKEISVSNSVPVSKISSTCSNLCNDMSVKSECQSTPDPCEEELIIDGHFFLKLVSNEQARLAKLADLATAEIETLTSNPDVSEEVIGFLRSAAGKARLLISQKMKQFEGLCYKNLNPEPEEKFYTTVSDLQGFWDMVNLQIINIDSLFSEMDILRKNNWQKSDVAICEVPIVSKPKIKSTNVPKKPSAEGSSALEKRELQRKQIMDLKRRSKKAIYTKMQASNLDIVLTNKINS